MSNITDDARNFLAAMHATACLDACGANADTVRYLYTENARDARTLADTEGPLPTWYPSGRAFRGGSM